MPKTMRVMIDVPSGSRPAKLMEWLNKLLEPHKMRVVSVEDSMMPIKSTEEEK